MSDNKEIDGVREIFNWMFDGYLKDAEVRKSRIEEIKTRLEAVKTREWVRSEEINQDHYNYGWSVGTSAESQRDIASCIEEQTTADLIAHAPSDIEYLLGLIEELKGNTKG